jgi:acyl-CoA synthetase (AMP-forming)/AMP-acid ligase II
VAIVLPNCIEAVVACYGTWLAGGVAVPLDAQAAAHELGLRLSECNARCVVHAKDHRDVEQAAEALPMPPMRIVWTCAAGAHRTPIPRATQDREPTPGTLALLLYTSGPTPRPRGVMLSYGNIVADVHATVAYLGLTCADSVVTTLPFHDSCGASVLHTHLSAGARLVIAPEQATPHGLVETIAKERVSGFSALPEALGFFLERAKLATHDLSSLRYVAQAGGAVERALVRRARAALPQARLFATYGRTEATAHLTGMPPERLDQKPGSVGLPVPGVRLEIRRHGGEHASPGEVGEVWATGDNVMIGFLNDPATTRDAIRDGWLRTGDVGHIDSDGFVFLSSGP